MATTQIYLDIDYIWNSVLYTSGFYSYTEMPNSDPQGWSEMLADIQLSNEAVDLNIRLLDENSNFIDGETTTAITNLVNDAYQVFKVPYRPNPEYDLVASENWVADNFPSYNTAYSPNPTLVTINAFTTENSTLSYTVNPMGVVFFTGQARNINTFLAQNGYLIGSIALEHAPPLSIRKSAVVVESGEGWLCTVSIHSNGEIYLTNTDPLRDIPALTVFYLYDLIYEIPFT